MTKTNNLQTNLLKLIFKHEGDAEYFQGKIYTDPSLGITSEEDLFEVAELLRFRHLIKVKESFSNHIVALYLTEDGLFWLLENNIINQTAFDLRKARYLSGFHEV